MDGFQVLEHLHSDPSTRAIPVITVTGKAQQTDVMQSKRGGAWGFILKPWENGEAKAMVLGAMEEIGVC